MSALSLKRSYTNSFVTPIESRSRPSFSCRDALGDGVVAAARMPSTWQLVDLRLASRGRTVGGEVISSAYPPVSSAASAASIFASMVRSVPAVAGKFQCNTPRTWAQEGLLMASTDHDELDIEALRARYDAERDKRLRADGNAQYVEIDGQFAHYLDDPYVDRACTACADRRATEVVVIGGGFGGLLAAARLREAGVDDIRIIEKGGDFGGTWYWNRYPGAACDIESYIYLPLLEEIGYIPRRKYARAPEILEHSQRIGQHFDLYERAPASRPRSPRCAGTRTPARWIVDDQPRRRHQGPLRGHGQRPAAPAEAARHPGHRDASRATASTPAAGTTTTPAATPTAA